MHNESNESIEPPMITKNVSNPYHHSTGPTPCKGKNMIVNLYNLKLSNDEESILKKGLKFCPTQKRVDAGERRKELDSFHNKLCTKQFFERENNKSANNKSNINVYGTTPFNNIDKLLKLKKTSNWKAPTGSPSLETFITINTITLNKTVNTTIKNQNVTENERRALKSLSKNKDITIKPADKGGAIVIMNTVDYIKEAHRQLDDENTYKKLKTDPTKDFTETVNKMVEDMVNCNEISKKVGDLIKAKNPRTPQIYFLPKIHKNIIPPPGRPIVSANSCPTENISAFVDIFLNPLVSKFEHHIKDTTDFLNKIKNMEPLKTGTIIGSMDITSLYTNIPNIEGVQSIKDILAQTRSPNENPKNDSLTKLLKMVLEKNNF